MIVQSARYHARQPQAGRKSCDEPKSAATPQLVFH